jgi:multisubunit Na+/H+ antiporter MnhC subunit
MSILPFLIVVWVFAVGLYGVVTSRHLMHLIMCLIVVQSSTYVLLPRTSTTYRREHQRSIPSSKH